MEHVPCARACLHLPCSAFRQAAAKVSAAAPQPAPKVERATVKVRKAAAVVTNTAAVTNAARQARWRSKQDAVAIRGQAQERMKALRARRKANVPAVETSR